MAFIPLDNPKMSGRRLSPVGTLITVRASGPKTNRVRFLAVLLGPDLAKSLNFVSSPTPVNVAFGNGDDFGKLRIMSHAAGKFVAKRQAGGGWLVTVRESVLGKSLKPGSRIAIDRARHVPANGNDGSCTILPVAEALQ
jgi:hypothetical protein